VRSRCAALLLSGGGSRRWDRHPKALIPVRGRPALEYMAEVAVRAGCEPIVAVTGPGQELAEASLGSLPVRIVRVDDAPELRTGSIQAGLAALPSDRDLLLWPVDHPFVRAETVAHLVAARTTEPEGSWWVPEFGGLGGHPVVIAASVLPRIRALRPDAPLREARPDAAADFRRLPVGDPGILANIDTPESYRSFLEAARGRGEVW